jgi:hypothetical protein
MKMKKLSIEIVAQEIVHNYLGGRITEEGMKTTGAMVSCLDETPIESNSHWQVVCDAIDDLWLDLADDDAVGYEEIEKLVKARVAEILAYRTAEAKSWAENRVAAAA